MSEGKWVIGCIVISVILLSAGMFAWLVSSTPPQTFAKHTFELKTSSLAPQLQPINGDGWSGQTTIYWNTTGNPVAVQVDWKVWGGWQARATESGTNGSFSLQSDEYGFFVTANDTQIVTFEGFW